MTNAMQEKIQEAIGDDLRGLIRENMIGILASCGKGHQEYTGAGVYKYSFGTNVTLEPRGLDMKVSTRISYGTRTSEESAGRIVTEQPELFEQ